MQSTEGLSVASDVVAGFILATDVKGLLAKNLDFYGGTQVGKNTVKQLPWLGSLSSRILPLWF